MTARELEKLILAAGWVHKETKGSHKQFVHPQKPGKLTIPQHKGDLKIKTANAGNKNRTNAVYQEQNAGCSARKAVSTAKNSIGASFPKG